MNHVGEIARLAQIAAPTIVARQQRAARAPRVHGRPSTRSRARTAAAIAALGDDGVAVFPADDAHAPTWREIAGARRIDHASRSTAGRRARGSADLARRPLGRGDADAGRRGDLRRCASAARTTSATRWRRARPRSPPAARSTPIVRGLEGVRAVRGRSQAKRFARAGAERHADRRQLQRQSRFGARRDRRPRRAAGAALARPRRHGRGRRPGAGVPSRGRRLCRRERGIESLWAAGAGERRARRRRSPARARFADVEALIAALGEAPPAASVLVKGSRFMRMERVVAALTGEPAEALVASRTIGGDMLLSLAAVAAGATRPSSASCACSSTSPSAP